MLIRHMGSEIRIFAYFKNLTLIAAFLGLGVGYLYKPRVSMLVTLASITALAVASHPVSGFSNISTYLNLGDFNMWEPSEVTQELAKIGAGLVLLVVLFFTILISMVPLGQALAEIFDRSKNRIVDYSINILGALIGVWFFSWLSFEQLPPIVWYIVATAILFVLYRWDFKTAVLFICGAGFSSASLFLADPALMVDMRWSPYQKIRVAAHTSEYHTEDGKLHKVPFMIINTNQTIYLYLLDLSMERRAQHRTIYPEAIEKYLYYDLPYNFVPQPDEVLVLGSGGGNDMAAALRAGAKHVTGVEIDPVIIEFGTKYHPEKPYSSDKVTIVNNDARNFLRETDGKYDLIVLGLLDSHTLTSSFSNTNLDSFMYTVESVRDMRAHLKDGGVLALSFQVAFPWIGGKLLEMITSEFGEEPVVISRSYKSPIWGTGGTYFFVSNKKGAIQKIAQKDETLLQMIDSTKYSLNNFKAAKAIPQTDDWPYLYVPTMKIPKLHLFVSGLLLLIFAVVYGMYFGKPTGVDLHFAALGAGFLLLEVSVISRFALFWGTTWVVSSIVISLILVTILIANATFIKSKGAISYPVLYGVLALTLVAVYFVPLEANWVILLYLAPFTVIGYLFAKSFDGAENASHALGYNLFGALAGGLSESFSFIFGISALILIALGFYAVSMIARGGIAR